MMLTRILWMIPWLTFARGEVHVGAAFNVFPSFGDLGAVLNIRGQAIPWFPNYDAKDVFEHVLETRRPFVPDPEFTGEFLLQLCDNVAQLKGSLYRDYAVEGVDQAARAYTGGWSRGVTAVHLGVNSSYLLGGRGYAIAKLTRHHEQVMLSPDYELHLDSQATAGARQVIPGQADTVFDFIADFGSHYVSSYTSGDSLYQVFVLDPINYGHLYKAMRAYEASGQSLDQVLAYLTPWHTEHIGRIVSLSGNSSLELWAETYLRDEALAYSSLLRLHSAPELLRPLDVLLGNAAVLGLQLSSLAPYFPDDDRCSWFTEVVDNHVKLWEISV